MPKTKLRALLEQLHGELDQARSVDPEARALLEEVVDEIHEVLDRDPDPGAGSLGERLNQRMVDFESSHPQVAFTLERVVKLLSDIGI